MCPNGGNPWGIPYTLHNLIINIVIVLHFIVEPAITAFTVQPLIARVGESLSLNCSAMGHPTPRYEITKMGSNPNIPVGSNYEESGVLTISNVTLSTGGSYTCLVHCGFENPHSYLDATNVNVTIYGT